MFAPRFERLEVRRLFVAGTAGDDVIQVVLRDEDPRNYRVILNGVVAEEGTLPAPTSTSGISISGGAGNDMITMDPGLDGRAFISGGDGNDTIFGGSRYDIIGGDAGNDLIFGKAGHDWLIGGAGNDTLKGGDAFDDLYGDASSFFDNTTDPGDDLLFGEGHGDVLHGGGGNDLLNGGAGNDRLEGDGGDDQLLGADGDDTIPLSLASGNDTLDGGTGGNDTLSIFSPGADPFYLTLEGVANDGVRGERNNVLPTFETISGGPIGDGSVIDLSASPFGVTAWLVKTDFSYQPEFATAIIGSPFADNIQGGSTTPLQIDGGGGNDTLRGSDFSNDAIFGGPGNDTLFGGGGKDSIFGEDGDDSMEGGRGNDSILAGVGNDVVFGDDSAPGNTVLYGADTIEGNAGSDTLIGGGNADRIFGHGGRDLLIGGGGNDVLFGGPEDADRIFGNSGTDSAANDEKDTYDSVENLLT